MQDRVHDKRKDALVRMLHQAAELEQNVLLVYLYAIFSLKQGPDATCRPAEWESVRRWYSQLFMIARQEMEHLSLVQSLLIALGEPPYFGRSNLITPESAPQGTEQQAVQFPIELAPFKSATAREFVCIESPTLDTLVENGQPIPRWCFEGESGTPCVQGRFAAFLKSASSAGEIGAGTIEELYAKISVEIQKLGDDVFVGSAASQPKVLSEYDIFIFPVTDAASALAAVDLITKQGEGSQASHTFRSHFHMFYDMLREYEGLVERNAEFQPVYPWRVVRGARDIENETTRAVFELCNYAYVTTAYMLAGYYDRYNAAGGLSQALGMSIFAPMMTMVFRPVVELLATCPINAAGERTGPTFFLTREEKRVLENPRDDSVVDLQSLETYVERLGHIRESLRILRTAKDLTPAQRENVVFMYESTYRLSNNLPQIFTQGVLPNFQAN